MQLVEQHVIGRNDPRYRVIDEAAFASKNLYNAALYELRQALSKPGVRDGLIRPSGLPITIATEHIVVDQVRIVPRNGYYVIEIIYTKEPVQANVDPSFCVGIDLGVTNLAAIASNREGFVPRLVNGRPLKAWNQWYNKRLKALKK